MVANIKDLAGKDILIKGLNGDYEINGQEPDQKTRESFSCKAALSLAQLDDNPGRSSLIKGLISAKDAQEKIRILMALAYIGCDNLFDLAAKERKDPDPGLRYSAMLLLGQIDSEERTQMLIEGLNDNHPAVRIAAISGLARLQDKDQKILNIILPCLT